MIARLPGQRAPMGENLELVCLLQAAEIERLCEYLEEYKLKCVCPDAGSAKWRGGNSTAIPMKFRLRNSRSASQIKPILEPKISNSGNSCASSRYSTIDTDGVRRAEEAHSWRRIRGRIDAKV
jgi:hypothetical protein